MKAWPRKSSRRAKDEPGAGEIDGPGAQLGTEAEERQTGIPSEQGDAEGPVLVAERNRQADEETEQLIDDEINGTRDGDVVNKLGDPLNRRSPFYLGLMAGLGLLVSYGLIHMLLELAQIFTYILVAVFLALGLDPLVSALVQRGLRRGWAVLVVISGLLIVLGVIVWTVVPTLAQEISTLIDHTPGYLTDLQNNHLVKRLDHRFHLVARAKSGVGASTVTSVLGGLLGAGKALVDGVLAVVIVLVLTVYLMAALPSVKVACYKLVPQGRRARVVFLGEEISRRVGAYVLGQAIVAVINGFLTWIMLIFLGLPFAAVLAVLAGLLALVPIVGTVIGGIVITLIALSVGWSTALFALGYYIAYHALEAYVLSPRIMHKAVEVAPVVTIVAVLAGGALMGVVGAMVAIPVAAGLSLIYDQVLVPRQQGLAADET